MRVIGLWLFAFGLVAALVWGLEQVAMAPLETGEVYPPYSSLRSDPLGSRALFESLATLPGLSVERLYLPRAPMQDPGAALFILGVDPRPWSAVTEKTLEEYEELIRGGGRLVIGFLPVPPAIEPGIKTAVESRWHTRLAYRMPPGSDARHRDTGVIPRRSALYFDSPSEWRTISRREGRATAVDRPLGGGTIVLVADSYLLSNEGLREERDAEFISRLVGPARRIAFDENHFGIVETGSVASLIRKYRLEGAAAMLALVAALFLWRSASSLLPPRETRASAAVTCRDSLEGMSALLRRGIPEKDLFDACYAEWARSQRGPAPSRLEEAARLAGHDPVKAYRAACRALLVNK